MAATDATYTPGGTDAVSRLRFLTGDTAALSGASVPLTVGRPFLYDAEYTAVAALQAVDALAAAICCDVIAARLGEESETVTVGQTTLTKGRAKKFAERAALLRSLGPDGTGLVAATMHVGGLNKDEVRSRYEDTTVTQPQFNLGQDDNPFAGGRPPGDSEP